MPLNRQNTPGFFSNPFKAFDKKLSETAATTQALRASKNPNGAPPKASAATNAGAIATFTGLCEALNAHQSELVADGRYEVADFYEIIFFPPSIAAAKVKKPGTTDQSNTPMQNKDPKGSELLPTKNSMNTQGRTMQAAAGTQIVQFIDQVLKGSSYISDQQTVNIDEVTGKVTPQATASNNNTAWYKINVQAEPLGWDSRRNDFAYKLTYMITPYSINNMQSDFFPKSRFRGVHKSYNYWFTGDNTEVLDFQQEFNNLYRLIISGNNIPPQDGSYATSDNREITRRIYMATSEQSSQGAGGYTVEPAANAADYLYSPSDQARARLRIVGDPAWLMQGEVATGANPTNFSFQPFNSDGSINFDASEVVFDISFNRPVDYNIQTGIMDTTTKNLDRAGKNLPQENLTYTAIKCRSTFSRGRFEQELEGRLLIEYFDSNNPKATTTATQEVDTPQQPKKSPITGAAAARQLGLGVTNPANLSRGQQKAFSTLQSIFGTNAMSEARSRNLNQAQGPDGREVSQSPNSEPPQAGGSTSAPQPLPAPPPAPPTSTGDIRPVDSNNTGGANYTVPPKIGTLRLNNGRVVEFLEPDRASYERALASGATPVVGDPQPTSREF